eukprot:376356_1
MAPTFAPSHLTTPPTMAPTFAPSHLTITPTMSTMTPTFTPTHLTTAPTIAPTISPTDSPTLSPTQTTTPPSSTPSQPPTSTPTESPTWPTIITNCSTSSINMWCYYVNVYPISNSLTTFTVPIQNIDDNVATYFDVFFTSHGTDCNNPSISFEFEEIDYRYSYLDLYDNNDLLIQRCDPNI